MNEFDESDINSDEDFVLHLEESDQSDTDVSVYEIIDIEKDKSRKRKRVKKSNKSDVRLEESDQSDTDVSVYEIFDIEKPLKPKVVPDLPDVVPNDEVTDEVPNNDEVSDEVSTDEEVPNPSKQFKPKPVIVLKDVAIPFKIPKLPKKGKKDIKSSPDLLKNHKKLKRKSTKQKKHSKCS